MDWIIEAHDEDVFIAWSEPVQWAFVRSSAGQLRAREVIFSHARDPPRGAMKDSVRFEVREA
jgi:hypothetical protein